MIISFLQTRTPPILPSLQQQPHVKAKLMNSLNVAFDKDPNPYRERATHNKETLGELLFQFFRYYGHEMDFENSVMSVRLGKVISKAEKGWHLLLHNRLCVEEPFNNSRNLGNTADDASMRGIHLELRRAFKMLVDDNLEKCCEEYEHPLDEGKGVEKFVLPSSRPIVAQAPAQSNRGGRGGGRGGRNSNQYSRGQHNTSRRASSASNRGQQSLRNLPFQLTPQELQLQQQHQQYLLHDHLFQQYQYLQAQEQELRMQLHQQAAMQGRVPQSATFPHTSMPSHDLRDSISDDRIRSRAGTVNHPFTAPMRQQGFPHSSPYLGCPNGQGPTTNPPSPHLSSAFPDLRRNARRSSLITSSSGGSLRAHSQPARPIPSPLSFQPLMSESSDLQEMFKGSLTQRRRPSAPSARGVPDIASGLFATHGPTFMTSYDTERHQAEYLGYYVGHTPPLQAYPRGGLAVHNCASPNMLARTPSYQSSTVSPPSDPFQTPRTDPVAEIYGSLGSPLSASVCQIRQSPNKPSNGPLIVNGAMPSFENQSDGNGHEHDHGNVTTFSGSTSEDFAIDTPSSSDVSSQDLAESLSADPDLSANALSSLQGVQDSGLGTEVNGLGIIHHGSLRQKTEGLSSNTPDCDVLSRFSEESADPVHSFNAPAGKRPLVQTDRAQLPSVADGKRTQVKIGPQLSPVKEVPTPPPMRETRTNGQEQLKANCGGNKAKGKGKQEKSTPSTGEIHATKGEVLATKPNGVVVAPGKSMPNGTSQSSSWQLQKKKKHKKASKSEIDVDAADAAGGDFLPVAESARKGG